MRLERKRMEGERVKIWNIENKIRFVEAVEQRYRNAELRGTEVDIPIRLNWAEEIEAEDLSQYDENFETETPWNLGPVTAIRYFTQRTRTYDEYMDRRGELLTSIDGFNREAGRIKEKFQQVFDLMLSETKDSKRRRIYAYILFRQHGIIRTLPQKRQKWLWIKRRFAYANEDFERQRLRMILKSRRPSPMFRPGPKIISEQEEDKDLFIY
jgi:hypothetical protein